MRYSTSDSRELLGVALLTGFTAICGMRTAPGLLFSDSSQGSNFYDFLKTTLPAKNSSVSLWFPQKSPEFRVLLPGRGVVVSQHRGSLGFFLPCFTKTSTRKDKQKTGDGCPRPG